MGRTNKFGYVDIIIGKAFYKAHRLAWLYVYGEDPKMDIDHVNGDRADNRIINLRQISRSENLQNQCKPRSKVSGYLGVTRHFDGRWRARVRVNGKYMHLGCFSTALEASIAYKTAKSLYHPCSARL